MEEEKEMMIMKTKLKSIKGIGSGWHGDTLRHRRAKKFGKAAGSYSSSGKIKVNKNRVNTLRVRKSDIPIGYRSIGTVRDRKKKVIEGQTIIYAKDLKYGTVSFTDGTKFKDVKLGDRLMSVYKDDKKFKVHKGTVVKKTDDGVHVDYNGREFYESDSNFNQFNKLKKINNNSNIKAKKETPDWIRKLVSKSRHGEKLTESEKKKLRKAVDSEKYHM